MTGSGTNAADSSFRRYSGPCAPDGDCLGSTLGLYHYIKTNYPDIPAAVYLEQLLSNSAT